MSKHGLAKVRHRRTRKVHAVRNSTTDYRNGSLVGFWTCCGRVVKGNTSEDSNLWVEVQPFTSTSCGACQGTNDFKDSLL